MTASAPNLVDVYLDLTYRGTFVVSPLASARYLGGLRDRNQPLTWVELRGFEFLAFCSPCTPVVTR
jgi:hypothetical protein